MKPTLRHESAIPRRAQRNGFAGELYRHTTLMLGSCRVVPDGYIFDEKRRRLYYFEVYVTHQLTADKLDKLRLIRDVLADLGWTMRVSLATSGGDFRLLDWATGQASITERELRRAINGLGSR